MSRSRRWLADGATPRVLIAPATWLQVLDDPQGYRLRVLRDGTFLTPAILLDVHTAGSRHPDNRADIEPLRFRWCWPNHYAVWLSDEEVGRLPVWDWNWATSQATRLGDLGRQGNRP